MHTDLLQSLTDAWNWRATFFFLAAFCALSLASFLLFKDTFRRERSSAYQAALARHTKHGAQQAGEDRTLSRPKLSESKRTSTDDAKTLKGDATPPDVSEKKDLEAGQLDISKLQAPVMEKSRSVQDVKLTFRDINPFTPLPKILRLRSNLIILLASGESFLSGMSWVVTDYVIIRDPICFQLLHPLHLLPDVLRRIWLRRSPRGACASLVWRWKCGRKYLGRSLVRLCPSKSQGQERRDEQS